jgi:hypothetical protein
MYVEERMYQLVPGGVDEYFKQYGEYGLPVQLRHLPHLVGYYRTEVGTLDTVVHLWAYDSLDQRDLCRKNLWADPDWQAYRPRIKGLIVQMDTRILKCAPFFLERLKRMLAA